MTDAKKVPEDPTTDNEAVEEVNSEPEFWGRTQKEWWGAFGGLMSISMVVLGILGMGKCDALPSLPTFCIVFGISSTLSSFLNFLWRTDKCRADGIEMGWKQPVSTIVSLSILPISIWGAALTFPNLHLEKNGPNAECESIPFWPGFIGSVTCLGFFCLFFVMYCGMGLQQRYGGGTANDDRQGGADVEEADVEK